MRGQSEVIAALLMTAIVLVGFAIVWVYLYPRYLEWERQVSSTTLESRLAASEQLVLGKAIFRSNGLDLTLVNTGDVQLRVRAIYVNESLVWQGSLSLAPGQHWEVSLPLPKGGRIFWIKVCSGRGNCWIFLEFNLTTLAASPPPPPPPPPAPPFFQFASYTSVVYGQPGRQASFDAEVENRGGTDGYATVGLYDETSKLVASRTVYVPAGTRVPVTLNFTMPESPGVYTWTAKVYNLDTGSYDDEKIITVTVISELIELIRNGDFSQGSDYWTLEAPWVVNENLQLACINLTNVRSDFSASISQAFEVTSTVTLTQLELYYYMQAHPPGQVSSLQLVIGIENVTTTLWTGRIIWPAREEPVQGTYTAPLSLQLSPGTYRLRITAVVDVKAGGLSKLDIRVDNVSLLATAP